MKIGFFTDEYLPRTDGVVTSMINFKKGLEDLGHEVFIIAPTYPGYHDEPNRVLRIKSFDPIIYDNIRFMVWGKKKVREIADLKLDIIHSQTNLWASALALQVARKTDTPHVASIHMIGPKLVDSYVAGTRIANLLLPLGHRYFIGKIPEKSYNPPLLTSNHPKLELKTWQHLGRYADMFERLIIPSAHLAEKLKNLGVSTKLEVIPNAIDLSLYQNKSKNSSKSVFNIVCVGRLSGEKRQNHLIDAVAALKKKDKKIHLTLVGSGPARRKYERQIDKLGLNKETSFTGQLEPHNVKQLLAQADVGALVSNGFDNQPMVILEYAAAGLPILYCDPDLQEGLSSDNSLLCKEDSESIAAALNTLQSDEERRVAMSQSSIEIAKQYDIASQTKKLERIYRDMISS